MVFPDTLREQLLNLHCTCAQAAERSAAPWTDFLAAAMASDPLLSSRAEADLERLEQGGVSADFCFEDIVAMYPKRAFKW